MLAKYLLDFLQSLYDSDVVQVDPPCSVPVLDGGAVFRDCQSLQKLEQVVVVVVDDAVYKDKKLKIFTQLFQSRSELEFNVKHPFQ